MTGGEHSVRQKILVALDVETLEQALALVAQLKEHVGGFKVGLELCNRVGTPQVLDAISKAGGQLFLDSKFKDIPATVAGAAKAVSHPGVLMVNVHCDGGREMLRAAVAAAASGSHRPLVIGVTVLTSVDTQMLNEELRMLGSVGEQAVHLARLAQTAGLDSVVCSPLEVAAIKEAYGQHFLTVVPGICPPWAVAGDQKRVTTPKEAVRAGADYLVIGRPITCPPAEVGTPAEAARRILEELSADR
jgi:orotidine-5'-phosphate decarboxylase